MSDGFFDDIWEGVQGVVDGVVGAGEKVVTGAYDTVMKKAEEVPSNINKEIEKQLDGAVDGVFSGSGNTAQPLNPNTSTGTALPLPAATPPPAVTAGGILDNEYVPYATAAAAAAGAKYGLKWGWLGTALAGVGGYFVPQVIKQVTG
jgi:hypothetical protein